MSERELCQRLYAFSKEGAHDRLSGTVCPYAANTVAAMLHSFGWIREDLRQALIKANPRYGEEQHRLEKAGVFGDFMRDLTAAVEGTEVNRRTP